MRIERKTLTVVIESPDGNVTLIFDQEMPLNKLYLERAEISALEDDGLKLARMNQLLLEPLISIEGLEHPDGAPVTVEDIKALRVYPSVIDKIITALIDARSKLSEAAKKNDTSSNA